eukprot:CAMPEP_0119014932 /NCGR_PEP_ID=MMETSP1176-20130426/10468_1 /TAXON_ID=265551 /ORGANISM="Synedropsis recta cf, Strain CCMP1620" /LENGTH=228 /DNA_ID=CAMNT_0006968183 /DNA_START=1 /DNA_END=687 /DNA_ORIENTATION=-
MNMRKTIISHTRFALSERNQAMVATASYVPPPPFFSYHNDCSPASMSNRLSINKKRLLPRKVGFAQSTTVAVIREESVSQEERSSSWYTSRDYQIFGKDAKTTVKHIRRGRSFSGLSGRGLEKYFSPQYHEEKKRREKGHYRSILVEQQRQRSEGTTNPKVLSVLSVINSKWALQNALKLAKHDHSEVSDPIPATATASQPVEHDSDSDASSTEISLKDDDLMSTSSV